MASWWIVFLLAVVLVALFVLGMSLRLLVKGRHPESEISQNRAMRAKGIKCAIQETLEQDRGKACPEDPCTGADCAACAEGGQPARPATEVETQPAAERTAGAEGRQQARPETEAEMQRAGRAAGTDPDRNRSRITTKSFPPRR